MGMQPMTYLGEETVDWERKVLEFLDVGSQDSANPVTTEDIDAETWSIIRGTSAIATTTSSPRSWKFYERDQGPPIGSSIKANSASAVSWSLGIAITSILTAFI
jgi:hypothetical protein